MKSHPVAVTNLLILTLMFNSSIIILHWPHSDYFSHCLLHYYRVLLCHKRDWTKQAIADSRNAVKQGPLFGVFNYHWSLSIASEATLFLHGIIMLAIVHLGGDVVTELNPSLKQTLFGIPRNHGRI